MKFFTDLKNVPRFVGITVSVVLLVFEIIICAQYINVSRNFWLSLSLIFCCILLDVFCAVEMHAVKTFKTRIVMYGFAFLMLLAISTISGNSYLSAMYCVILTQLYVNVDNFKSKLAAFITGVVAFVASFVIGWVINHAGVPASEAAIEILSGCILGVIIISAHFVVATFLIQYYNTIMRLTQALKEADESKARLKEAYEQLSETAVYEERNRIAREIHDNAGHSMTAVIMQTEAAKVLMDSAPQEAKARIISANIQAKNALEQMRESVHLLAGRGATASLKVEAEEIIAQSMDGTDLKIRSDVEEIELDVRKRRFLTGCLKECLANGVRHGRATAFYVEIKKDGDEAVLIVSDNGVGLPEDFKEGYGIRGMREKAAAFGGSIIYESERDEGTEVCLRLPLKKEID